MDQARKLPRGGQTAPDGRVPLHDLAHDLGFTTAAEGLDLDTAIERLRTLRDLTSRRRRRRFDLAELPIALTSGWVAGVFERGVDVSLEVLRLDAHERYRRCQALDLDPGRELALVVFRITVDARSDAAAAAVAVLRALARAEFAAGEPVAVSHDKLLVLVQRTDQLAGRVHALAARMNVAVSHLGMSAAHWIEPLSSDSTWLDDHIGALIA